MSGEEKIVLWHLAFLVAVIGFMGMGCAPVVSKSATMPVAWGLDDYDDIPKERCTPELHGMYLSYEGGNAALDANARANRSCARNILHAETAQKLAEARCPACDRARAWATAGVVLTVGGALLTLGLGAVVISDLLRR